MAKNIELFDHNEKAYQKLVDCLKTHDMCAINHATGTGKSFIALKYLYENRDKRILYLAPTYGILDQLVTDHMDDLGINIDEFNKFDTMIYGTLLGTNLEKLVNDYDIIVYDEYHRDGAPEWGKQIKKIKNLVRESNRDIKIIGLTATNKRYLDNERDMSAELFDGVVASSLSLSDAIVDGILPPPIYINALVDVSDDIEKLRKRLEGFILFDSLRDKLLNPVDQMENLYQESLNSNPDIEKYIKASKKNLVFSSTIANINEDKVKVERLFKGKNFDSYSVYSGISREKNLDTIRKFRESNSDDYHFLYSINMLNEGIHVKDVDSIIMLRETTSPIIYFQQLGRLLSFSRRKDKVVVFDLVNNLSRNHYIYDLMRETVLRAKEGLVNDPKNYDRYQNIIENFKIIDISSMLYKKLDELKKLYTREYLLTANLNEAISILENPTNYSEDDIKNAKVLIFKNEKYINLEMFRRINKLNIIKPTLFDHSEEEFIEYLDGAESISKMSATTKLTLKQRIENFVLKFDRLPLIDSKDIDEKNLASEMIYNARAKNLASVVDKYDYSVLSIYEQASYGLGVVGFTLNDLRNEVIKRLDEGFYINEYIYRIFDQVGDKKLCYQILYRMDEYNVDFDDSEFFDPIESKKRLLKYDDSIDEILFLDLYFSDKKKVLEKYNEETDKEKFLREKANKIIEFINTNFYFPRAVRSYCGNYAHEYWLAVDYYALRDEFKKYGILNDIDTASLKLKKKFGVDLLNVLTSNIVNYMDNNDGLLPSKYSKSRDDLILYNAIVSNYSNLSEEQLDTISKEKKKMEISFMKLYSKYIKYIKDNGVDPDDKDNKNYDILHFYERSEYVLSEEEKNNIIMIKTNYVYSKLIDFIREHKGFLPMYELDDKDYVLLYQKYKDNFTLEQKEFINNLLKSYERVMIQRFNDLICFLKENKRYPLENSNDLKESQVYDFYLRYKPYLTKDKQSIIDKSLSDVSQKKRYLNTYEQMLRNKGRC